MLMLQHKSELYLHLENVCFFCRKKKLVVIVVSGVFMYHNMCLALGQRMFSFTTSAATMNAELFYATEEKKSIKHDNEERRRVG